MYIAQCGRRCPNIFVGDSEMIVLAYTVLKFLYLPKFEIMQIKWKYACFYTNKRYSQTCREMDNNYL
jgi:hypothetical protein